MGSCDAASESEGFASWPQTEAKTLAKKNGPEVREVLTTYTLYRVEFPTHGNLILGFNLR
jgi:hypothetical protein